VRDQCIEIDVKHRGVCGSPTSRRVGANAWIFFSGKEIRVLMANRVARVLYRSILKEIRGLTLARGRRVLLLEEPDHKKWGHGQVT